MIVSVKVSKLKALRMLPLLTILGSCEAKDSSDEATNYLINDSLNSQDVSVWQVSSGWSNGTPFLNGWCSESILNDDNGLNISLEARPCSGEAYASGEYRTKEFLGYGRVEVEMKAAKGTGVVSSLFFYTGVSDGNAHEEIDIEILGVNPNRMQVNYWSEEFGVEKEHPTFVELGFNASLGYHLYAIEWRENSIQWYVDNVLLHSEDGSKGKLPMLNMRIFMNLWVCNAKTWCGIFDETILPAQAKYRNFKYTN